MKIKLLAPVLAALLLTSLTIPVDAQAGILITQDRVSMSFPNEITFSAEIQAGAAVTSIMLVYGADQLTCGNVVAQAFPSFASSTDVKVSWTWDMRQSGSLPPGATIRWHWLAVDAQGNQFASPGQAVTWLDNVHHWQELTGGDINLHWYGGGSAFGQELHDYAAQALVRLTHDIGVKTDKPIDLYIYASTQDLQEAVLYAPSWTGGQAYPEFDIVIIGIAPSDLEWGKHTEAHEMTHVLVGHETFSCLGFVPTWLNEGLAVYGQGGPDSAMQATFNSALASNSLSSVRSLTGDFPEAIDQADLAYGELYSIVNFLISQYGGQKMTAMLLSLRDGETTDQALLAVYGFDVDGLEDAWRASIGALPRTGNTRLTPASTPTIVPTIEPIAGAPLASSAAVATSPGLMPTATLTAVSLAATPLASGAQAGFLSQGGMIAGVTLAACLLVLLAIILVILIFVRRNRRGA